MIFPQEFLLAAACCRWPLTEDAIAAIRAAASEPIDWPYLLRIVRRQRIAGLVCNALDSAKIERPSAIARELATQAQRIARRNLKSAGESIRLQRAFDAAAIPVIGLKGVSLGQLAYGSLTLKHSRDIDVLVTPEHALSALRLLEREGYALQDPAKNLNETQRLAVVRYGKEAELLDRDRALRVELHWKLADNPLLLKGIDASLPARSVELRGAGTLRTLNEGDLIAYLCVHGAYHRWSRLKWLADVNALISAKSGADVTRLYRHAQEKGAGLCAGQALLLCDRLFATRLPASLASELHGSRRLVRLVAVALDAMVGADAGKELDRGVTGMIRHLLAQFSLGRGRGYFIAQCRILSVGIPDAILLPLPPSLCFLYPFLRLPLWLWRRAMWAAAALAQSRIKSTPLHR